MTNAPADKRRMTRDLELRARADRVIPGGMYGHNVQKFLFDGAPQFWQRGRGSRVWDVDGNEYIDLMCSWGPIIHGHRHPRIEEAVAHQRAQMDTGNGPADLFVELGELLVESVEHANWVVLAKNGSDVTTLALTVARAATGRHTVLVAHGAYHGSLPWCNPREAGIAPGDRAHLDYFTYNDIDSLRAAASRHAGDVAAVILTPLRHDAGHDQELVAPAFARAVRGLCDAEGAALVLDEVRAGFRIAFGSSWAEHGVHPDLSCWSKAIGNGYPISALLGSEALRDATQAVFIGGTFWTSAVPMAAALATIRLLRDEEGLARMHAVGDALVRGLEQQAVSHGFDVRLSGPSSMPYLSFSGDVGWATAKRWSACVAARGVYLNPSHNWFISTALSMDDVSRVLDATDGAFTDLRMSG